MTEEPEDTTVAAEAPAGGGVTWADIYDPPKVDRSLRHLPRLC